MPVTGFGWTYWWVMMACRKPCACRKPRVNPGIDFYAASAPQNEGEKRRSTMKIKRIYLFLSAALLLGLQSARAQEPAVEPGPPPEAFLPGGPVGPRMEILGFGEIHPGKVVAGAPYSAVAVT